MAVSSTYSSTLCLPRAYAASSSIDTSTPCGHGTVAGPSDTTSGRFRLVSMASRISDAGEPSVRLTTRTGCPVVRRPYIPAALIPMPCWPRDIFSLWNLEP